LSYLNGYDERIGKIAGKMKRQSTRNIKKRSGWFYSAGSFQDNNHYKKLKSLGKVKGYIS
jgi:hypothetical protein